ncbi:pilus assembly protein TadD [uncultured Photobacterium sp.]|uniref:tetratricopeptide repeat protein n=1 Tax=uncultured Photobacterium sp. TaxID=173973 RepID=UPI00261E99C0|nr:pilus assembly protein TadD [uncultured Photobacterium sp.]
MHNNLKVVIPIVFALSGCVSTGGANSELESKESLLISSNETAQLVQFYKDNLKENASYKLKLVQVYLDLKDVKSAELYSSTFDEDDYEKPEYLYTMAKMNYLKHEYSKTTELLEQFRDASGDERRYFFLSGKVFAEQGLYEKSISAFERSRQLGMPDNNIKNNIAVVKIMRHDFSSAVKILYDLYLQTPNDSKLRSNLILASVKAGRNDIALDALKDIYNDEQAREQLEKLRGSLIVQEQQTESSNVVENKPDDSQSVGQKASKQNVDLKSSEVQKQEKTKALTKVTQSTDKPKSRKSSQQKTKKIVLNPHKKNTTVEHIYRIQVLATYNVITPEHLNYLKSNYGAVYSYTTDLWNRYCVGEFNNLERAKAYMADMNIKGVFVVEHTNKRYIKL